MRPALPDGVTLRPIDRDRDLDAVGALFDACDLVDVGQADHQTGWLLETWRSPAFAGGWLAERDGAPVGYLELESAAGSTAVDAYLPVHPELRTSSLRRALLAMAEDEARRRAPGLDVLRAAGSSADPTFAADCDAAGFHLARTFVHMQRALVPPPRPEPPPPGVSIRTADRPGDDRVLYELIDASFREHYGYFEQPWDEWLAENEQFLGDPGLLLIAEADGEPIGVCTLVAMDAYGWVGELGVVPRFRGRGIGRALLLAGFGVLAERGFAVARLNVDDANESGATRLYERAGMQLHRSFAVYEKAIVPAG